ncbi:TPA: hypothetical protein DCE37_14105, partial [Candidatus Latescibacteria bacterium]|nr:hypothetical protein [Candidatus Latescibacterota bacterium]
MPGRFSGTALESCQRTRFASLGARSLKSGGCNWNLSCIIRIDGDPQRYLFRFNRRRYGRGDETIEKEQRHYALIAEKTGIPTPQIHLADLSRSIVPKGYMVMNYVEGENHGYLTHPDNPTTSPTEKEAISRAA